MLRGYRCIILAIAGMALAGAQQSAKQIEAAGSTQPIQNSPKSAAPPAKSSEPTYRPYAERNSDACYNAQNHDTADLCAQWRAAIAAENTAKEARIATIAAIIGIFLSIATVAGLIVTIWQTHGALGEARRGNRLNLLFERRARRESRKHEADQSRALKFAEQNAKAAIQANALFKQSLAYENRAYVIADTFYWSGNEQSGYGFGVNWKNIGKTPTKGLRTATWYLISDSKLAADYHFEIPDNRILNANAAPGAHFFRSAVVPPLDDDFVNLDLIKEISSGSKFFYIFGWAKYFDIFGQEEHVTKCCAMVDTTTDEQGNLAFVFPMWTSHNCMDQDCED